MRASRPTNRYVQGPYDYCATRAELGLDKDRGLFEVFCLSISLRMLPLDRCRCPLASIAFEKSSIALPGNRLEA